MVEFQIIDAADQQFGVVLNDQRATIRLRYNTTSDRWSFDLSFDDQPLLYGRRIVTGVDLLAPFKLGLGILFASSVQGDGAEPSRYSLPGGLVKFYHTTEEEVAEAAAT